MQHLASAYSAARLCVCPCSTASVWLLPLCPVHLCNSAAPCRRVATPPSSKAVPCGCPACAGAAQRCTFKCVVCVCGCRVLSPRPGCSRRALSATPSWTRTPPPPALPVTSSTLPRSPSATPSQHSSALWRSPTHWWGRHMQQGTSGRMQGCAAPWAQLLSFSQFINLPIDILIGLCAALCSCCSVRQLSCRHCGLHAVCPRFCRSTMSPKFHLHLLQEMPSPGNRRQENTDEMCHAAA